MGHRRRHLGQHAQQRAEQRRALTGTPAPGTVGGRGDVERGAAVVEFVLVSLLLVILFLGVAQVGVALHVRNTLVACAAEGARHGANGDRGPADAQARTQELIRAALADSYASDVSAGLVVEGGVPLMTVRVRAALPMLGPLGPAGALTVQGHAVEEAP